MVNSYYDANDVQRQVDAGRHRELVGGQWDELGRLQLDFLISQGMRPQDRVLDVGCGALRAGICLVPFLEPGHYFGIDLHASLLDAGYEREIVPAGLADRLPRENLQQTGTFEAGFSAPIDIALATSVFTHLPANYLRVCLESLEQVVVPGGRFFVTYFEAPDGARFSEPLTHTPGNVVSMPTSDPYHYRSIDVIDAAAGTKWSARLIGRWDHPRNQQMAVFDNGDRHSQ